MKITNHYKPSFFTDKALIIFCLSTVVGVTGCQQEGSAEKAGKKIDNATENIEHNMDELTKNAGKKIEAAKESLDQKAEKTGEYIDKSTAASEEALEKAGESIDQATEKAGKELEGAKEAVIEKSETTGDYIDDSVITLKVKAAILNDTMFKGSQSQISVTTVNGVVKLSGSVDSEPSIGRAMEVAGSQKNVKSVQTDLIVNTSERRNNHD